MLLRNSPSHLLSWTYGQHGDMGTAWRDERVGLGLLDFGSSMKSTGTEHPFLHQTCPVNR